MATRGADPGNAAQASSTRPSSDGRSVNAAHLRVLEDVSRAFTEATPGFGALVQTIARVMADHIGDGCVIMLLNQSADGLDKVADAHHDRSVEADCRSLEAKIGAWQITGNTLPARVARTGVPELVVEVDPEAVVARVEGAIKSLAARLRIHSLVVVAIRSRARILGSLALVRSRSGHSYTTDDLSLLQELADRAGLAIENARLNEEAKERAAELEVANELSRQHTAFVDNTTDAVISLDAKLCIRRWNRGAEQMFGWSREEVLGSNAFQLLGVEVQDAEHRESLRQLYLDGHWGAERQLRRKDGTSVLVSAFASALDDEHGQTGGFLLIAKDVGRLRQAEAAARQFAALVKSTDDAIQCMTLEGILQTWNRGAEELYGYTAAEAIGRHISFIAPGKSAAQMAVIEQLSRGERVGSFETVRMRKDGSPVDVSLTISPILDDTGRVTAVSGIARDISERRKLERQLVSAERMASLGVLAAGIAHEINNPLAYVLGNLETLLTDLEEAPYASDAERARAQTEMLLDARDGAERIARILRGLRTYSRTEDVPHIQLSLQVVLETALRLAQHELKHCARIVEEYAHTPPVTGDEGALVQVFVNLLVNAAHALPEEWREKNEVRIVASSDASGRAVVEVSDTGTGIPESIRAKLFEPFVTSKPAGKGSGLGLSICQRIVTAHGGEISFDTNEGVGTTFRVVLPPAVTAPRVTTEGRSAPSANAAARRGSVMVVDDEPVLGELLSKILSSEHDVVVCREGRAALDRIAAGERFDVILCDLSMPGFSGMDFHAELVRRKSALADRVIFISGDAFSVAHRAFLDSVANPWVVKPFYAGEVRELVRNAVETAKRDPTRAER